VLRRRWIVLVCLLAALVASGCGTRRAATPDVATPRAPAPRHAEFFPTAGVRFRAPQNWRTQAGTAPLVATVASGQAIVAVWRYPRTEILPTTKTALRQARVRLMRQARKRDAHLRVVGSRVSKVDHQPAIELVAQEVVAGQIRLVRSTHVFGHGAEIVVDAYAPPATFPAVNQAVFAPLIASLRLAAPKAA
jgi:hypothetical protein